MAIVGATYAAVGAFYLRLALHALRWGEAARRSPRPPSRGLGAAAKAIAGGAVDIVLLRRLLLVNPALWLCEWLFHATLLLVAVRHLRYFTEPVPLWVWWAQTPGWIAGFLLPPALLAILALRLLTKREKFSSRANLLLLLDLLGIAATGLLLSTRYRVDLAQAKAFALGILAFNPEPPPSEPLFALHFGLVLVLIVLVPSHVLAAPLTIVEARRRERELPRVLHDA